MSSAFPEDSTPVREEAAVKRGWRTGNWVERGVVAGVKVGLFAAVLNMLILGSFLSSSERPALVPSALWWIPGSLTVTAVIAAVAAHFGGSSAGGGVPRWPGLIIHITMAAVVWMLASVAGARGWWLWPDGSAVARLGKAVLVIAGIQVLLGVTALAVTAGDAVVGDPGLFEVMATTAHQACGALLLATSVGLALLTSRS